MQRTRAALQDSLASLLAERAYDSITVEEICAVANVGRTTFYAHYTSKDDLKRGSIDDRLRGASLAAARRPADARKGIGDAPLGFALAILEHARDHRRHHDALAGGKGGAVALGAVRNIVSDLVRDDLASRRLETSVGVRRDFAVQFVTGAFMSVLTWWLEGAALQSPEEVASAFRELALQGLRPPGTASA